MPGREHSSCSWPLGSAKLPTDRLGFAVPGDLHQAPSKEDLAPWVLPQGPMGGWEVCPAGSILLHAGHPCRTPAGIRG